MQFRAGKMIGGVVGVAAFVLLAVSDGEVEAGGGVGGGGGGRGGGAMMGRKTFAARGSRGPGGGGGGGGDGGDEIVEDWELQYGEAELEEEKAKAKAIDDEDVFGLLDMEEQVLGKEVAASNWAGSTAGSAGAGGAFGARQAAQEAIRAVAQTEGKAGAGDASLEKNTSKIHSISEDDVEIDDDEDDEAEAVSAEKSDVGDPQVSAVDAEDAGVGTDEEVSLRVLREGAKRFFKKFRLGGGKGKGGGSRPVGGLSTGSTAATLSALLRRERPGICECFVFDRLCIIARVGVSNVCMY